MRFLPTPLEGAFVLELEPFRDDRGAFARAFCVEEFQAHGLSPVLAQANLSLNPVRGTLRGLHYQVPPAPEAKLVRCMRGALYDVIVDLRAGSPSRGRWFGVELSEENGRALYVPELCAHGFQTLTDDVTAFYQVSHVYTPGTERGLRYDDPSLGIDWPVPVTRISDKDATWPLLAADGDAQAPALAQGSLA